MREQQPNLFDSVLPSAAEAGDRRDEGIARAADRNERRHAGWQHEALGHLATFLSWQGDRTFLAEEVREYAVSAGLVLPTDGRAWGALMQLAKRLEWIVAVGYAPARSSNLSPKVLWQKGPCG